MNRNLMVVTLLGFAGMLDVTRLAATAARCCARAIAPSGGCEAARESGVARAARR